MTAVWLRRFAVPLIVLDTMSDGRALVFVYGTLRAGGVRAIPALFPDARLVGAGAVRGRLLDFGAYPGLVLDPDGPGIAGEVYEVSGPALAAMDEIERYDPADEAGSYYLRRPVSVTPATGGRVEAWAYVCGARLRAMGRPIPAADWIAHARAKGPLPPEAWPDGASIGRPRRHEKARTSMSTAPRAQVLRLSDMVAYQDGAIVSRQITKADAGNVTLFAFDAGQELSEHTAPFDALVQVLDGAAEVMISGRRFAVSAGEAIILPAGEPHAVRAVARFRMLLTMIRA